jgi:hypothetical protein
MSTAEPEECWACGKPEIAYVDVLDMGWCDKCFISIYLDEEDS